MSENYLATFYTVKYILGYWLVTFPKLLVTLDYYLTNLLLFKQIKFSEKRPKRNVYSYNVFNLIVIYVCSNKGIMQITSLIRCFHINVQKLQ